MLDKGDIDNVHYIGQRQTGCKQSKKSIDVIGIDTEADIHGNCFMICTSLGDVFKPQDFPACLFGRKYRSKKFVAYNLRYDESAVLKLLPLECLQELRETGRVEVNGYLYKFISYKFLSIRHNKHTATFYDLLSFYGGSLESNAVKYLKDHKTDIDTKRFTHDIIRKRWDEIAKYCIQDAVLVKRLADHLIGTFESYGVYPKKLYSTAYVTYQYFRERTNYVTVYDMWYKNKDVLRYAMRAYNGGKFEITRKYYGQLYEYDIVSAYPHEISNLIDISNCTVRWSQRYFSDATYGFLECDIKIPYSVYSPIPIKLGQLCVYPCGEIHKTITKAEYEYLLSVGCDITIRSACYLYCDRIVYPYRQTIHKLVYEKQKYKNDKKSLKYHTVKLLLNSLYGKFVQLIPVNGGWQASTCWNPIYGAIITANTRIAVSKMQQIHPEVIAVHTDSVITTKPLDISKNGKLGQFSFDCKGIGLVLGCGVYQIGDSSKIRGFRQSTSLVELCKRGGTQIPLDQTHVESWRECAWRGHDPSVINRFDTISKILTPNFDKKRLWENDYETFDEIFDRSIIGEPIDGYFLQRTFNAR